RLKWSTRQGENMRILSSYIILGAKYAILSAIVALAISAVMHLAVNKVHGGNPKKNRRWIAMCLFYMCFIGCTAFLNRGDTMGTYNLKLFSSFLAAVFSSEPHERVNILLNVLLYVPLGVIFSCRHCPWRKWYLALSAALALSIMVEAAQHVLHIGYTDVDDVFCNLSGTVIGYSLFRFLAAKKEREKRAGLWLLPALCPIVIVGAVLAPYLTGPFGHLNCERQYSFDMRSASVEFLPGALDGIGNADLLPVYTTKPLDAAGAEGLAETIFESMGTSINETIKYDTCIVLYSQRRKYMLWYEYLDGTFTFKQYLLDDTPERHTEITESYARALLNQLGIVVPQCTEFAQQNQVELTFKAHMSQENGDMWDGSVLCCFDTDGQLQQVDYQLLCLQQLGQYDAVSAEKISQRIKAGHFYFEDENLECDSSIQIRELRCQSSALRYQVDTKGFYRPVYEVAATINGKSYRLMFPAT
ncbi:MAG: VanZ family protein, partial [Bacillota bacterium]